MGMLEYSVDMYWSTEKPHWMHETTPTPISPKGERLSKYHR